MGRATSPCKMEGYGDHPETIYGEILKGKGPSSNNKLFNLFCLHGFTVLGDGLSLWNRLEVLVHGCEQGLDRRSPFCPLLHILLMSGRERGRKRERE